MKMKVYLVVGADKSVRAAKRPQIKPDEVAVEVTLTFPDTWGKVVKRLEVDVPDWTPQASVDG